MSNRDIAITFLTDGGQPADATAGRLAEFLAGAQHSLDVCIYDANLPGEPGAAVQRALRQAIDRGVALRIAYFREARDPGEPDPVADFVAPFQDCSREIHASRGLMHDKYVVRDAGTPDASVWTGSTNWTTDSWTRQENVIVVLPSIDMTNHYRRDFEEMWGRGAIEGTGGGAGGSAALSYAGQAVQGTVWFSPDAGPTMAHAVAHAISVARTRIALASPVITDGPILGALLDVLHDGHVPISGLYDRTQMEEAVAQWRRMPVKTWKIAAFESLASGARLSSKRSTPYAPGSVHNYLHVKLVVIDDSIFTGSYNLSHNGETNAENLNRIDSPDLANLCADWIGAVAGRYATVT